MKKRLFLAAAAMAAAIGLPSFAAPNVEDHIELLEAVDSKGVVVLVNDLDACSGDFYGAYLSRRSDHSVLVLCQENRSKTSDEAVRLTEEDADTIRHEAWHMVQDCVYGGMGDAYLRAIYNTPEEVVEFARDQGMSDEFISRIIEAYEDEEAYVIIAEIEAFTVAATFEADSITNLLTKYCEAV